MSRSAGAGPEGAAAGLAKTEFSFKISRRVRQRDESKERRILAATLEIVGRQGLAGLAMEAVARAAGVATGTVYTYFESKEALLNALYVATKGSIAREVFQAPGPGEPVRPAFERMCVAYLRFVVERRAELVFMQEFARSPFVSAGAREQASRAAEPLVRLLERGKAEALLKDLPTPLMIAFLQAALDGLGPHVAAEPKRGQAERHAAIARMAWDALKA